VTATQAWALAGVVVGVGLAALLGAAQTALSKTTLPRAQALAEQGQRGASALVALMRDPARTLNIVALLAVVVQVVVVVLLTVLALTVLAQPWAAVAAAAAASVVLFTGAEVAPRTLAVASTERVACALAPLVRRLAALAAPFAAVLVSVGRRLSPGRQASASPYVTEDELRAMIDAAESEDVIEPAEREMIHSIFELGDTVVREIMVPRPDMVTVGADATLDEVLEVIIRAGYSRLPVWSPERDRLVGVVYAKDVLMWLRDGHVAGEPWDDLLRAPYLVPELKRVDDLLRELQAEKVHLAIVVDEYGATVGIVTIEDILEEIVGEIVDEYDSEQPLVEQSDDEGLRVDARLPVDELAALLSCELPDDEWDTVGGLIVGLLGHVPTAGEHVDVDDVRLTAESVEGRRVAKVRVERVIPSEDGAGDDPDAAASAAEPAERPDRTGAAGPGVAGDGERPEVTDQPR